MAVAGAQSFGGRTAIRPPPGRIAYSERATSTTLRIKAANAHIAPRAMHASAKVIGISVRQADEPPGHHGWQRRRLRYAMTGKVMQLQGFNIHN